MDVLVVFRPRSIALRCGPSYQCGACGGNGGAVVRQ